LGKRDLWVFGYGSLMWRPGFPFAEVRPALLRGYHRALCIYSHRYRGTPERPGLVVGLDVGGSCIGRAYRVAAKDRREVLAYLDEREMFAGVYARHLLPVRIDGRRVTAVAYVTDRRHAQYTGRLAPERAAALVRQGIGKEGSSLDYLRNTVRHLDELGIKDGPLHRVLELAEKECP
jgi:cation transport protein ChaC